MFWGVPINMKAVFESVSESCDRFLSDLTRFRSVLSDFLPITIFGRICGIENEEEREPPS